MKSFEELKQLSRDCFDGAVHAREIRVTNTSTGAKGIAHLFKMVGGTPHFLADDGVLDKVTPEHVFELRARRCP